MQAIRIRIFANILIVFCLILLLGCNKTAATSANDTLLKQEPMQSEFVADYDIAMTVRSIVDAISVGEPLDAAEYNYEGVEQYTYDLAKAEAAFKAADCEKDKDGNLLPDEKRLTKYGKMLRSTSLDELPELWNILKGDLSIVGPRPLLPEYLKFYTEEEKHRHDVRPGLTGLAQISGRNAISWNQKLYYDYKYVNGISFISDVKIMMATVGKVIKRSDIQVGNEFLAGKFIDQRKDCICNSLIEKEKRYCANNRA